MEKEEFFIKRIRELATLSYRRDIVTFSDFLNLNEQNIVNNRKNQIPGVVTECFGGYEQAERQMIAFHPDALAFTWEYPITCLKVEPKARKFSEDLGHRDYLGAVLNLGIERSVIGDILIQEHTAWIFCHNKIADFLVDNLDRIRHTAVKVSVVDNPEHYHRNLFFRTPGCADRTCFSGFQKQHGFFYRERAGFCKWQTDHFQWLRAEGRGYHISPWKGPFHL